MNLFWSVVLLQSLLLLLFNFNQSFAQSSTSENDFKSYKNKNNAIELMYPSDWTYVEFRDKLSDNDLVIIISFISPLESSLDTFQEYFTIKSKILDPGDSFSNHFNSYLEKLKNTLTNINISNIEDISTRNKFIEYSFSPPQSGLIINKDESIFLKNSTNVFHIEFTSSSYDYKTFNKIMSYFRIT
jgi:hypothetical protein